MVPFLESDEGPRHVEEGKYFIVEVRATLSTYSLGSQSYGRETKGAGLADWLWNDIEAAAQSLGAKFAPLAIYRPDDIAPAFDGMRRAGP